LANGVEIRLSPGAHSQLIKEIIEQFGPRFAKGAEALYIGETGVKMSCFDEKTFQEIGLKFVKSGKFPDVVLYLRAKNWLFIVESVTSTGPVNAKRHQELDDLFAASTAALVFVTAFPDRKTMAKYLPDISWETEVWVADSPTHLIHFDGERFLGPYEKGAS
jgi:adenine-specific DNA-methyltransferase